MMVGSRGKRKKKDPFHFAGWSVYDATKEYTRIGVNPETSGWRLTNTNGSVRNDKE